MALLHVSLPPAQACGGEDILYIYIFLVFPGHLKFWTPLQTPIRGPPLACTLFQYGHINYYPALPSFEYVALPSP